MQSNNYTFSFYGAPNNSVSAVNMLSRFLSNSRIWYAAVVPIIALFAEVYATDKYLGVLVWLCAAASAIAACIADRKYIASNNVDTKAIPFVLVFLPPIYIFRRLKLTFQSAVCGIVSIVMIVYALVFNNFIAALTLNEDGMIDQVKENFWFNISGCSSVSESVTVSEKLEIFNEQECGNKSEIKWQAEQTDGYITVRAYSEYKKDSDEYAKYGNSFDISFRVEYDGYAFGKIEVTELTVMGEKYEGKQATEKLLEIAEYESKEDKE
ncbi:MAG: hypothetical protein ACI4JW_00650 [Oscillospiraceae bacterium]